MNDKIYALIWFFAAIIWAIGNAPIGALVCMVPLAYYYARIYRNEK